MVDLEALEKDAAFNDWPEVREVFAELRALRSELDALKGDSIALGVVLDYRTRIQKEVVARLETAQVKFEAAIELDAQRQARIAELTRLGDAMAECQTLGPTERERKEAWRKAVRHE